MFEGRVLAAVVILALLLFVAITVAAVMQQKTLFFILFAAWIFLIIAGNVVKFLRGGLNQKWDSDDRFS